MAAVPHLGFAQRCKATTCSSHVYVWMPPMDLRPGQHRGTRCMPFKREKTFPAACQLQLCILTPLCLPCSHTALCNSPLWEHAYMAAFRQPYAYAQCGRSGMDNHPFCRIVWHARTSSNPRFPFCPSAAPIRNQMNSDGYSCTQVIFV